MDIDPTLSTVPSTGFSGVILSGRYRLERELGSGGFGRVYLARDQQIEDKPVVIKIMLDRHRQDSWFEEKFSDEVKALARIDHPGVVGVLDRRRLSDGTPFLVMQYVEGRTLRSEMGLGRLELSRIARVMKQIGQALSAAHDKGVWHRDLKPENIMLQTSGGDEFVKLIDFGIAKVREESPALLSLPEPAWWAVTATWPRNSSRAGPAPRATSMLSV